MGVDGGGKAPFWGWMPAEDRVQAGVDRRERAGKRARPQVFNRPVEKPSRSRVGGDRALRMGGQQSALSVALKKAWARPRLCVRRVSMA